MQAEKYQIPVKSRENESLNQPSQISADKFWAIVRRLQARVETLETGLSTARRDINRLNGKYYKEPSKEPPAAPPPSRGNGVVPPQYDPALFGGG